ncbi:MAG: uracil-DNA glycosylase [bacterium JZ-2024 1]
MEEWQDLQTQILNCHRCPRLRSYCETVALTRIKRYHNETYWGKPVPGFGDEMAWLWIIGLAPGAHGANRTGRMFTGDDSGKFLFRSLFRAELANKPDSMSRNDGLRLQGAYVSAVVRCAPPQNKPDRSEISNCFPYLGAEFRLLRHITVIVTLGKIAYDGCRHLLKTAGWAFEPIPFSHGGWFTAHPPGHAEDTCTHKRVITVISSYHPSRQNTRTGRLTEEMLDRVWELAKHHRGKR